MYLCRCSYSYSYILELIIGSSSSLLVPEDGRRLVRLLEVLNLLFAELHVETACKRASYLASHRYKGKESELTEDILEIGHTRRPDDWGGHSGLRHDPRQRNLRHTHALLLGQFLDPAAHMSCQCRAERTRLVHAYLPTSSGRKGILNLFWDLRGAE